VHVSALMPRRPAPRGTTALHSKDPTQPGAHTLPDATSSPSGGRHDALVFDDVDHLVTVAVPWMQEGLAAGDAVVVAVGPRLAGPLREAVGDDPRVLAVDRQDLYRTRTPAAIAAWRRFVEQQASSGRRVRALGEPDFGRDPADWLEWQAYESVINVAFAPLPLRGLCVFGSDLPEPVLASVRRTHPQLIGAAGSIASPDFVDPVTYLRTLPVPDEPLEATPPALADDDVLDPTGLRRALRRLLRTVDGPPDAIEDFLLAVDEIVSNAVRHGTPPASLRLWTAAGRLVCTVRDSGSGLDDPLAGYGPAREDLGTGGMGVWLARSLCDHVAIRRDAGGVSVRLSTAWR
jgi:anti-sigma regulatory factor (Ser/Thr protein kinase)